VFKNRRIQEQTLIQTSVAASTMTQTYTSDSGESRRESRNGPGPKSAIGTVSIDRNAVALPNAAEEDGRGGALGYNTRHRRGES
jgi:hypothetical protein